jgi:opacity protein-like surface antigen
MGWTTFDGERGQAFEDNSSPGFGLGVNYYFESNITFGFGFNYSQNFFTIDEPVFGYPDPNTLPGNITVDNWRYYMSLRYYVDTSNLGSAITFANPYLIGRLEYWDVTYKYKNQPMYQDEKGKGLGWAFGLGLQFPLKMKEYNIGVEFLAHSVNWSDKFTQKYAPIEDENGQPVTGYGYEDLNGMAFDLFVGFNLAF